MIKITLSEVFLASVQVLDLYGWLGTYKDKKKKAFSLRDLALLECREGDYEQSKLFFYWHMLSLCCCVVTYRYYLWETRKTIMPCSVNP